MHLISKPLIISFFFTAVPGFGASNAIARSPDSQNSAWSSGFYAYGLAATSSTLPYSYPQPVAPLALTRSVAASVSASDPVTLNYGDQTLSSTAGGSETGSAGAQNTGSDGGSPSGVTVGLTGSSIGVTISTGNAPGVSAASNGGNGANGTPEMGDDGVGGGNGGAGGAIAIKATGLVNVTTTGDNAVGVQAMSLGGSGGFAGSQGSGVGFPGGYGGSAGTVNVDFTNASGLIATSGANAFGVLASSVAGNSGSNGTNFIQAGGQQSDGRHGGDAGEITVYMGGGTTVSTTGANAVGVVARSVSGNGGDGTSAAGAAVTGPGGNGGNGGATGTQSTSSIALSTVGVIRTTGTGAMGVLAQTLTGQGGAGGSIQSSFGGDGGAAGAGGAAGPIWVTHVGAITTGGDYAPGILAQSLSGAGGIGGSAAGLFYSDGGSATASSDGGTVVINSTGSVQTGGANSHALIAQSLGGGGGMGGDAGGMISVNGGSGAAGGNGGQVGINLGGTVTTANQLAHGAVAQSIGGGGGMGGIATAAGANVATAVGGGAGTGGAGGIASINATNLSLQARGTASIGLLTQSIGGGGGSGGGAYTLSGGALVDVAVAVGGSGGNGGDAGTSSLTVTNSSIVTGGGLSSAGMPAADAFGIVAQSIGGGGGHGGAGSAASFAVAVPTGEAPIPNVTFSGAFGTGGSGGSGGHGGTATATVVGGTTISTSGDGSLGAIVQSIGGGGGTGGDSSTLAATIGYGIPTGYTTQYAPSDNAINVTSATGGAGGSGGVGGSASLVLGDSAGTAASSSIATSGEEAIGALVQSIGGGGGNSGTGNALVKNWAVNTSLTHAKTVGATGGSGGAGGTASATLSATGAINTTGQGAEALVVQSIGGGGGVGSGGSLNFSGLEAWVEALANKPNIPLSVNAYNTTLTLGGQGGAGGSGGDASATNSGSISTTGVDAPAMVVQSVGGGGGNVGSAAAPLSPSSAQSTSATALLGEALPVISVNASTTVNVGGASGSSGDGGSATVTNDGQISTLGDYSAGIIAQSIGGGGGRAGTAIAGYQDNTALTQYLAHYIANTTMYLGYSAKDATLQQGGNWGSGGTVGVFLNGGSIQTGNKTPAPGAGSNSGFQSFGILAQSVGGGGGIAIDGTSDPYTSAGLGAAAYQRVDLANGAGPSFIEGGDVSVSNSVAGNPSITTYGASAHAIMLQSVGGGGGVFGAGISSMAKGDSDNTVNLVMGAGFISVGGGGTVGQANGGNVTLNLDETSTPSIATSGSGAVGVFAQSVGAGGGFASVVPGVFLKMDGFGSTGQSGHGGSVNVQLLNPHGSISTQGVGAHGIVAQSVGSGGGYAANYAESQVPTLTSAWHGKTPQASGNGGAVTVVSAADITTTGAGAYGILAQSIGSGGGFFANFGDVFAGSTGFDSGSGGSVNVTVQGSVASSGRNSIGVFAQSMGNGSSSNWFTASPVVISVEGNGKINGGSGPQGAGIVVSGGDVLFKDNSTTNSVTIAKGGSVEAKSGVAIKAVDGSVVNVVNHGTVTGSAILNGGTFGGTKPVSTSSSDAIGHFTNDGRLAATPGETSYVAGHLVQTADGHIAPHLDYSNLRSGAYVVTGNAVLDGAIRPNLASALPNIFLPALTVNGSVSGSLTTSDSALFSYTLRETPGQYDVAITGTHFDRARFGLTQHHSAVLKALEHVFATSNVGLGPLFAALDASAGTDRGQFSRSLSQLSPRSMSTLFARTAADASRIADASMSCPMFGSEANGQQAMLVEGSCLYVTTRGQRASLRGDADRGRSTMEAAAWQLGGQSEIRPGLLLGGSLAYQADAFSSRDGVSGQGSSVQGAVTLKYQSGPLLLTGAIFGSYGDYDLKRRIVAPGYAAVADADSTFYSAGIRARAAYTLEADNLYLRPYLNLDLVQARSSAFTERELGGLGLTISGSRYFTAILTPALEVGRRDELSDGRILRSFLSAGVSLRSNANWRGFGNFSSAIAGEGFALQSPLDRVAGRVSAGIQLYQDGALDMRLQYDGEFGKEATKHGATASLSHRF